MLTKQTPRQPYAGLTAIQADQAKAFLSSILLASNMAESSGVRMDMTKWIQAYRGHVGRKT